MIQSRFLQYEVNEKSWEAAALDEQQQQQQQQQQEQEKTITLDNMKE